MMHYFFLTMAILAEVCGTMALQASKGFTEVAPTIIVAVAYAISFFFLSLTLGKIPIAIAYSIWSGVGISLIAGIGYVWFNQPLNYYSLVGIVLITMGIIFITLSGNVHLHGE